jgi:predicted RNase H-like HicB family nuclease
LYVSVALAIEIISNGIFRIKRRSRMPLTAIFQKVSEGYIAFIEELPGANTQGKTLEETRTNLEEAVEMVMEANRYLAEERIKGQDFIRETFLLAA